jgi:hypothetical protein
MLMQEGEEEEEGEESEEEGEESEEGSGEEEGSEEEGSEEEEAAVVMAAGRSRRRHRSRNAWIDAELAHGAYGDDSYADLEDFLVCKRGRKY